MYEDNKLSRSTALIQWNTKNLKEPDLSRRQSTNKICEDWQGLEAAIIQALG